ncbi:MAG: capsular biosynthesis protein [Herminiimonas sp.]|nr:capsular biosynthesis protein [Herminiimonas sp.]
MKRLIVDLDETITVSADDGYRNALPNISLIERLRQYQLDGFEVVINTSRNVSTFEGNVGKINVHTLPVILDWLTRHEVPFDEIYVGKPWCGTEGFYIDDKAIRPSEFMALSLPQIHALLAAEKGPG